VTIFGVFLTPVFFYVIQGFDENRLFEELRRAPGRFLRGVVRFVRDGERLAAGRCLRVVPVALGTVRWNRSSRGRRFFVLLLGAFEVRRRIKQMTKV